MQTIIIDVFSFAEVCDAWGLTITILLCHKPITCLDNLDTIFSSFIIDQLYVAQNSRGIRALFVVWTEQNFA